jgi:hypothetical protein
MKSAQVAFGEYRKPPLLTNQPNRREELHLVRTMT